MTLSKLSSIQKQWVNIKVDVLSLQLGPYGIHIKTYNGKNYKIKQDHSLKSLQTLLK